MPTLPVPVEVIIVMIASGVAVGLAATHLWDSAPYTLERVFGLLYGGGAFVGVMTGALMQCRSYGIDGELYGFMATLSVLGSTFAAGCTIYHLLNRELLFAATNLTLASLCASTFATVVAYALQRERDRNTTAAFEVIGDYFGWLAIGPAAAAVVLLLLKGTKRRYR